jgi:rhodanese-related sulfurtransferase
MSDELTPEQVQSRLHEYNPPLLLDVRTHEEYAAAHIPGSHHLPLDRLADGAEELDPDREMVVVCAHGIRSAAAVRYLRQAGFSRVVNMRLGLAAWRGPLAAGRP